MVQDQIYLMKFYYVYFLRSLKKDFTYIGYTKDLKERLRKHNNFEVKSTKPYAPFELIFFEGYQSSKDARRREKYLKTTKGKTALKTMLKDTLEMAGSPDFVGTSPACPD